MEVTKISEFTKTVSKVYVDFEHTFTLLKKDIEKLDIYEGKEIGQTEYEYILNEIVYIQAKSKALKILERCNKTEKEMTDKLKQRGYTEYIINKVLSFLKEYAFIDDKRYTSNFISYNSNRKSKKQLEFDLRKKGIDKLIIEECMECYDESVEEELICKYLEKYRTKEGIIPPEKYNKVMASLYRKGFKNSMILKKMRED